jgi:hypothetical protein
MNFKIEDLSNNAKLDTQAREDIAGGLCASVTFKWVKVRRVKYVFGVKVVYYVWVLRKITRYHNC